MDAEVTEHLGYDKHKATCRGSGNPLNGTPARAGGTSL